MVKPNLVPYSPTLSTPPHVMSHLEELVDAVDPDYTPPEDPDVEVMRALDRNVQTQLLLQEKFKPARPLTALERVQRNDPAYAHLYRNRRPGEDRISIVEDDSSRERLSRLSGLSSVGGASTLSEDVPPQP